MNPVTLTITLIVLLLAATLANPVLAGTDCWTTSLTPDAEVYALAINPVNPEIIYAGTYGDAPSNGGVFRSTDGGNTWRFTNCGHSGICITEIVINPENPDIVYAGDRWGGVLRSTDAGITWTGAGSGLTNKEVLSLAIDPITPTTLYAGTHGGVFKSTNGGDSWSAVNTGLANLSVLSLAVTPGSSETLYAGTLNGIFKSMDGGNSWSELRNSMECYDIAIDPENSDVIFAGGGPEGVLKSTDGGISWNILNTGLTSTDVQGIITAPTNAETLYACTGGGGVFKSADGGSSWTAVNTGLTNTTTLSLAINPVNSAILYTGTWQGGVFKSTNGGDMWTASNNGLTDPRIRAIADDSGNPDIIYAGTESGGIFKSTDGGIRWTSANTGLTDTAIRSLAADPMNSGIAYAGTENGRIFKTINSGGTWTDTGSAFTTARISFIGINPAAPDTIYAISTDDGIFRSTDAGTSWASVNDAGCTLAIAPANPDILYATTLDGDFLKSTDAGTTWNKVNEDEIAAGVIAVDPVNSDIIYIGSAAGRILRSTDGGTHWISVSNADLNKIVSLAIDPVNPDILYSGVYFTGPDNFGVFKSTNSGEDWAYAGPHRTDVFVLTFTPGTSSSLYAGTFHGVFRYSHISPEMSLKQGETDIPDDGACDFGNVRIGDNKTVSFTIRNTGTETLTLNGTPAKIALSGADVSDFDVDDASIVSPVAPSAAASFTLTFTPSSEGLKSATVTIPNDDPDKNPYTFDISGNGTVRAVLTGESSGTVSTDSVKITVGGTDIVAYKYKLDSGTWSAEIPVATPISLTGLSDGSHTLYVIGKTSSGNWQPEADSTQAAWTVRTPPVVTTAPVTDITSVSAQCGGSVTAKDGYTVLSKGVCWNTSSPVNLSSSPHTDQGDGFGDLISTISGLTPNTTWYVRAYAQVRYGTAAADTVYGSQVSFTTTEATTALPGDADDDGDIDLNDAILVLQILSGTDTGDTVISTDADVNSDGVLGIPEAVYIMQVVSQQRETDI